MFSVSFLSTKTIRYPRWLCKELVFAKDALVMRTKRAVVRSKGTNFNGWSFVSFRNLMNFANILCSSAVVGSFPGEISWMGMQLSGGRYLQHVDQVPAYWKRFLVWGWFDFSNFSTFRRNMEPSSSVEIIKQLNRMDWFRSTSLGLYVKCATDFFSSFKKCFCEHRINHRILLLLRLPSLHVWIWSIDKGRTQNEPSLVGTDDAPSTCGTK